MKDFVGTYINFISHNGGLITAYIVHEDETSFDYIRDSMSRWSCDKKSVYQSAEKISRKKFIETVQQNAHDTKKDKLLRLNKELSSIFHIDDNLTMSNKKLLKKIKNINIEILQILESTIPTEKNIIKALSEFKKDIDVDYSKIIEILK